MNRKQIIRANQIKTELSLHSDTRIHTNCIRIHPTESFKHFIAKCKDCFEAKRNHQMFLTEAWTADRKRRFDFVNLDTGEVREYETNPKVVKRDAVSFYI